MLPYITILILSLHPVADTSIVAMEQNFCYIDPMAIFPGGDEALSKYLQKNVHYPPAAIARKASGKVLIQFKIDKQGRLYDIKNISPSIDKALVNEALRVVKAMPKWKYTSTPATDAPPFTNTLPIQFELPANFP